MPMDDSPPLDIIEIIIDFCALNDNDPSRRRLQDVKSFSLTCRSLLPRCQSHIFRSLAFRRHSSLSNLGQVSQTHSLAQLLLRSRRIAGYVREITYFLHFLDDCDNCDTCPVPSAIERLGETHSLILRPGGGGNYDWGQRIIRNPALSYLMQLPTIAVLKLQSISNFNPYDLLFLHNLRSLYLDGVIMDLYTHNISRSPHAILSNPIRLRELIVGPYYSDGSNDVVKWLSQGKAASDLVIDVRNLERCAIRVHGDKSSARVQGLLKWARYLKSLQLSVALSSTRDVGSLVSLVASACLTTLLTLNLTFDISLSFGYYLRQISQSLLKIAETGINRIEFLIFDFNLMGKPYTNGDDWAFLLKDILTHEGWESLKGLSFRYFILGNWKMDNSLKSELTELPCKHLRRISFKKKLIVHFSTTEAARGLDDL